MKRQDLVIGQLVAKSAEPIRLKRHQLKDQVGNLLGSILYSKGTYDKYLMHLDKASVYYVNQFLGQVTIIGDWVSKGYIPSIDDGIMQLERLFSLCREYSEEGKLFIDFNNPLKSLREKRPISDRIRAFEDFYLYCYIRNEIVMSLFDVITYDKNEPKKLFELIDEKFTVNDFKQMLTKYIEIYATKLINGDL